MAHDYEVVPRPVSGWAVREDDSKRPRSYHSTQNEARAAAKRCARRAGGGQVRIHGKDGRIRRTDMIAKTEPYVSRG
jgi:hypothetical protein